MKRISQIEEFGRIHREALSNSCRMCPMEGVDRHHIVYRSLGGDDDERNVVRLCRGCHDAVHGKNTGVKEDILPYLSREEQGYAASLIGIERAHRLLAPSIYRNGER